MTKECPSCQGEGIIITYERDEYDRGVGLTEEKCTRCGGTGKVEQAVKNLKSI